METAGGRVVISANVVYTKQTYLQKLDSGMELAKILYTDSAYKKLQNDTKIKLIAHIPNLLSMKGAVRTVASRGWSVRRCRCGHTPAGDCQTHCHGN